MNEHNLLRLPRGGYVNAMMVPHGATGICSLPPKTSEHLKTEAL